MTGVQSVVVALDTDMYVQHCTTGNRCTQQWVATITLDTTECEAGGLYSFDGTLLCQLTNQSYCPSPTGRTFVFTASSTASLCTPAEIVATDGGNSRLVSYKDAERDLESNTFDVGDFTYWSLNVVDNKVSIDSIVISKVELVREADQTVASLFQSGLGLSTAWIDADRKEVQSLVSVGTNAMVNFTILLDRSALSSTIGSLSIAETSESFTLRVYVILAYHGNFKRSVVSKPISRTSNAGIVVRQPRTIQAEASPKIVRTLPGPHQPEPQNTAHRSAPHPSLNNNKPSSSIFSGIFGSGSNAVTVPHTLLVVLIALGLFLVVG